MVEGQTFHIGDMLSVTAGVLASPRGLEGLKQILSFITGDKKVHTVALPRLANEAIPYLLEQHPWLREITAEDIEGEDWLKKVKKVAEKYGEHHQIIPMHPEDHENLSAEEDYLRIKSDGKVIKVDLSQDDDQDPPPSPYGDISWKTGDEDE